MFYRRWACLIVVLIIALLSINIFSVSTVLLGIQGAIVDGNLIEFSGINGVGIDTGITAATMQDVVTMGDGDATPDVSAGRTFVSQSNTAPTEITDLDNPTVGQIVTIVVGNATNPPTITDGGNFALSAGWSPDLDDAITLFVQADNDYIEVSRSAN